MRRIRVIQTLRNGRIRILFSGRGPWARRIAESVAEMFRAKKINVEIVG